MTRCTHDCWHARINKRVECVRTHSCMYVVSPESVKRASPFARLFPSRRYLWFVTSRVSTCIALPSGPVSLLASHMSSSTVHQLAIWCAKQTFSRQFTRLSPLDLDRKQRANVSLHSRLIICALQVTEHAGVAVNCLLAWTLAQTTSALWFWDRVLWAICLVARLPPKRGVFVHKNSLASYQTVIRSSHSGEPRDLTCPFKQSNLSAWSYLILEFSAKICT